ncbi:MAG TPA: peroxidase family protein [Chthoniobacterales bacterium]|jgi:hypothetical protein
MNSLKIVTLLCCLSAPAAFAANPFDLPQPRQTASHVHHSEHATSGGAAVYPYEFRSIDGYGNNSIDPLRGSANTPLLRHTTVDYGDGSGSPAGANQLSARLISNLVVAQDHSIPNATRISDFVWDWGQFVDHDIDLTPTATPEEPFNVPVPAGDPWFDPNNTGTQVIGLDRSAYQIVSGIRQQVNAITSFLDGSQVYGSDPARMMELRTLDGTGRMKTSTGNFLPYNVNGFPNAPDNSPGYFLAGDVRANEQVALTALQTLFVREHNFWANAIHLLEPYLDGDGVFYRARAIVGAEIQIITYRDFLPLLLGKNAIPHYTGYHPNVDPSIESVFSTAIYRVGHTMLSPTLLRLDSHNHSIGNLDLADAFFNPSEITGPGIEPYLRGLSKQVPQEIDPFLVDGVRNFLFGPPGAGGFDLASLNIQRGRDHGLPRYNVVRQNFGLAPKTTFAQITSDHELRAKLAAAYATPNDIDVWVGALAENHVSGELVGQLVSTVLKEQFTRLRDGDRFWYQSYLPPILVLGLETQNLTTIIQRNTTINRELQGNVFLVPPGY